MSVPDRRAPGSYLFGPYEILETLGQGGMGVVYRALDVALDRPVVLKVLREDLRQRRQIVARFQREAEAIAALDHPHIVHIYSVGEIDGIPYMAMEYVEALALSDLLERDGPMSWRQALDLGSQVASALALAHSQGIIHRDIKPGNVLIDASGKAYVTDFGIAKVISAATQLTLEGQRLGTPQYMCPERCRNGEVTPASDIYSLGVLLFQAISGHLPHEASTPAQLMHRIVSEPAARLRTYVPDAPEDVERLLAFMLEGNPKHRPQSAVAVLEAIARVRDGRPLAQEDDAARAITDYRQFIATPAPQTPVNTPQPLIAPRRRLSAATRAFRILVVLMVCVAAGLAWLAATAPAPIPDAGAALWRPLPPLAETTQETPTVSIARLALSDFSVSRIGLAGNGRVTAQIDGRAGSGYAGQRALAVLDAYLLRPMLVIPPMPNAGAQDFTLLVNPAYGGYGPIIRTETAALQFPGNMTSPAVLLPGQTDVLALSPDGLLAAVARNTSTGAEISVVDPQTTATLATHGMAGEIVGELRWSSSGIIFARTGDTDASGALYALAYGNGAVTSQRILEHVNPLGAVPQSASSTAIVCSRPSPEGTEVALIDPASGTLQGTAGPGILPTWALGGNGLLCLDPDRAGRLQLWQIAAAAPYERRQLTFVDAGLAPALMAAEHETAAYVALANAPAIVRVDLSEGTAY